VNGRTIDYVGMRDDSGDPGTDAKLADQLAHDDSVFAAVPVVTPALAGAARFTSEGVPFFGWALSSEFCSSPVGFGFNGCLSPATGTTTSGAWAALLAKTLGGDVQGKSAAVMSEASPSGQYALRSLGAAVQATGLRVAFADSSLPVPPVGDYDGIARKVMTTSGDRPPDVVFALGSYSNVLLLRRALAEAGYTGLFTDAIEYAPQLAAAAQGTLVFLQTAAIESASSVPAMQQLVDDVRKVAPTQPIDQAVIAGYLSADHFVQVLGQRPKNLTVAKFLGAAERYTFNVKGVAGPTQFPRAHREPTPCGSLVQSDGTAFTVKVPYTCAANVPFR
jgi:ABC-type branched-subunit amino acid transport system substrate-binding protein